MNHISQAALEFFVSARMRQILWIMLFCSLSVVVIPQLYELYFDNIYTKEKIDAQFAPIEIKYGIKIVYEVDESFLSDIGNALVPAGPPRHCKVTPIRPRDLILYPRLLPTALDKYPLAVIHKYLNAIHFAGEINRDGFFSGGSYDPFRKIIFLVDNGRQSNTHGIETFHHELSSLLLNHHSLFLNPWFDQNPKEFVYLYKTEKDRLKIFNSTSLDGTEADYKNGFMNTYGQTNFENDFNEYSAMIFTYPEKFKQIMNQYPRVRGKFLVWLKFYQEIDPVFTEEYFFGTR